MQHRRLMTKQSKKQMPEMKKRRHSLDALAQNLSRMRRQHLRDANTCS